MELIDIEKQGGLTVTPHPITLEGQRHIQSDLIPGETLTEFLSRHIGDLDSGNWIVSLDGYEVPQHMWARTMPKDRTIVECRATAKKEVLRIVALVALAWFTMGAGGMGASGGGSFLGLSGTAGWLAAGSAFVADALVINKIQINNLQSGVQK